MKWWTVGFLLALSPVPAAPSREAPAANRATIRPSTIKTFYRGYHRLTPQLHRVTKAFSSLCSIDGLIAAQERFGPHALYGMHLFANPPALDTIRSEKKRFPVGAVIVKEKWTHGKLQAITGMIKRRPGKSPTVSPPKAANPGASVRPDDANWDYFYWDPVTPLRIGPLQSCAKCHAEAAETDFVFRAWKPF